MLAGECLEIVLLPTKVDHRGVLLGGGGAADRRVNWRAAAMNVPTYR